MILFDYILGKLRLRDAPAGANQRTITKTIGLFGVAGVDYNFLFVPNSLKQFIQIGLTDIIPADSPITSIVVKCTQAVMKDVGAGDVPTTATNDVGSAAGTDEHISAIALELLDQEGSVSQQIQSVAAASSVWFSITPGDAWTKLTKGKWKIRITLNDNSLN